MTDRLTARHEALQSRLAAAGTLAGSRVDIEQTDPTAVGIDNVADILPRYCIYSPEDEIGVNSNASDFTTKTTTVIDCWGYGLRAPSAPANATAAAMRNRLEAQALKALLADGTFLDAFGLSSLSDIQVRRKIVTGDVVYGCSQIILVTEQPLCFEVGPTSPGAPLERVVLEVPDTVGGGPEDRTNFTADIQVTQ